MIDVSIIIVSWNVSDFLCSCLKSIEKSSVNIVSPSPEVLTFISGIKVEVIVVDSASSDNTLEMLKEFPYAHVIPQNSNLGFAKCSNIGLKVARGRHLFLLNPDTEIVDDAIWTMVDYLDRHPSVGVVGPFLINSDGSLQKLMPRIFPTFIGTLFDTPSLEPYTPKNLLERLCIVNPPENAHIIVDWVIGAAMVVRREVYDQIGLLDEKYPMYCEEVDWCVRAKNSGWEIMCIGTAKIIHHGGKSSEKNPIVKKTYFWQSYIRYFQKYHSRLAFPLRMCITFSHMHMLFIDVGKSLLMCDFPACKQKIILYKKALTAIITYPYKLQM